jgi:hypothetical protein
MRYYGARHKKLHLGLFKPIVAILRAALVFGSCTCEYRDGARGALYPMSYRPIISAANPKHV